jgi:hypothetical protein
MESMIEFVAMTPRTTYFDNREAFQLRKDRPLNWLQKICFFILRKLRAFYIGESVTIERHKLDGKTFIERLFKQQQWIIEYFNKQPKQMIIGAEDYAELMNEIATTQTFSFLAEYGYNRNIMGITVQVIPYMRGMLVLPN